MLDNKLAYAIENTFIGYINMLCGETEWRRSFID